MIGMLSFVVHNSMRGMHQNNKNHFISDKNTTQKTTVAQEADKKSVNLTFFRGKQSLYGKGKERIKHLNIIKDLLTQQDLDSD
jgi:hypothetical protein